MMYWAVRTTLLRFAVQGGTFAISSVVHPVKMLSMVQLQNLWRIEEPMPNLFSFLRGKRHCRVLFTNMLVCVDHVKSLVMWTPRNLKLWTHSTTAPTMWMGAYSPLFLL
jgi:hypothetical protein